MLEVYKGFQEAKDKKGVLPLRPLRSQPLSLPLD